MRKDINIIELASYCALYCGACDIYQQRIGKPGKKLKEVLDAWQFGKWVTKQSGFEEYEHFYKILNKLIVDFGQCPGCKKGGGDPECKMRSCCQEKGYQTCAQCPEAPCEILKAKIASPFPNWDEDFQELKEFGLRKWSEKQQEKVNKGLTFSDLLTKKLKAENK